MFGFSGAKNQEPRAKTKEQRQKKQDNFVR